MASEDAVLRLDTLILVQDVNYDIIDFTVLQHDQTNNRRNKENVEEIDGEKGKKEERSGGISEER